MCPGYTNLFFFLQSAKWPWHRHGKGGGISPTEHEILNVERLNVEKLNVEKLNVERLNVERLNVEILNVEKY